MYRMTMRVLGKFNTLCFALGFCLASTCMASDEDAAREITDLFAPTKLMAAYSCTLYAEAELLKIAVERGAKLIGDEKTSLADVRKFLQDYDDIIVRFCNDVESVFMRRKEEVTDALIEKFRAEDFAVKFISERPRLRLWAASNAEFLTVTQPLLHSYLLLRSVRPDLVQTLPKLLDHKTTQEIRDTSAGLFAEVERSLLIRLLQYERFRELAPKRYKLAELMLMEQKLRSEASAVGFPIFGFWLGNAMNSTRYYFGNFKVIEELGIVEILYRYIPIVRNIGR